MKRKIIALLIMSSVLCLDLARAEIDLLNKTFELYCPNRSKTAVKVNRITGQVNQIRQNGRWVELEGGSQKFYQNLYDLQKDLRSK